jgi:Flp pilus assembly protein TadD
MGGGLSLSGLTGCQGQGLIVKADDVVMTNALPAQPSLSTEINPSWMYDILVAEMLAIHGDFVNAYHVMMRVASQSQDVQLAERAFHFAVSGYEPQGIEESAALWRSLEPANATPWRIGYIMSLREGNLEQALLNWFAYRERSADSLEADLKNAASQIGNDIKSVVALAFFERLYERYPEEWSAGYVYGFVANHYQQPQLAAKVLEEIIRDPQADRDVYFALINIYLEQDWYQRGIEVLAPYMVAHPDDWTMQERYARLEVRAQQYDAAEARYKRIVSNNPQARASQLSLALLLLDRGDIDAATPHFHALLLQQVYQDIANYYLGLIYHGQNDAVLAREHLSRVEDPVYYFDAQLVLAQLDFDQSGLGAAMSRLASLMPDASAIDDASQLKLWRAQGSFYSQAQQWQDAVRVYREAYSKHSELLPLIYAYALSLYHAELDDEYEFVIKRALQLYPDEADLLNALGYFYAEKGINLSEAEALLDRALEIAPSAFQIIDSRGWLAYQQGEFELAEKLISQAWSMQQDEEVLLHLIKVKWALRKFEEAEALWQDYHQHYSDNNELQNLLIKLRADLKKSVTQ